MKNQDYESKLWIKYELKVWIRNERHGHMQKMPFFWSSSGVQRNSSSPGLKPVWYYIVRNQLLCYLSLFKPPNFIKRNLLEWFVWSLLLGLLFSVFFRIRKSESPNSPVHFTKCKCLLMRILIFIVKPTTSQWENQLEENRSKKLFLEKVLSFNRRSFGSHARCPVVLI